MTKTSHKEHSTTHATLSSRIGNLRDLKTHPGWKEFEADMKEKINEIKEKIWTPCSDQTLRYNADHLLKERLVVLYLAINYPTIKESTIRNILESQEENAKPLFQRIEEVDSKLARDILNYFKS